MIRPHQAVQQTGAAMLASAGLCLPALGRLLSLLFANDLHTLPARPLLCRCGAHFVPFAEMMAAQKQETSAVIRPAPTLTTPPESARPATAVIRVYGVGSPRRPEGASAAARSPAKG